MKQVKILYEKCRKKMPNRPPDEIDFGLGFRAGLEWILSNKTDVGYVGEVVLTDIIRRELQ